ncbi:DUF418 domain-containing protein [Yoonia vestfoldensis]|uniref:DUF418 domain-containing protein n=1 Tax=Yoonia vestfoldensis TaxID=245188 RepID=UPI0003A2FA50|nr:DUF418 domain-containing protein [Yoonia vestfoldensis]
MTRTSSVDALRGFALLGIGIVNLPYLALPMESALVTPEGAADLLAKVMISLLFEGKFFVLFSFLFGWGFGVQLAAAARAGIPAGPQYGARLIALALFGIMHAILVFHGDILLAYAVLGAGLWTLRDGTPRRLVRIALAMVPLAALAFATLALLEAATADLARSAIDLSGQGYQGSFRDAVVQRLADWPTALTVVVLFNGPLAFGAFCLGLAAQKTGFFEPTSPIQHALAARVPVLLAVALPANAAYAAATLGLLPPGWPTNLGYAALALGAPTLAAVYVVAVLRLAPRLDLLTAAGSMPLTGYVAQGLVAGALFHGWGDGIVRHAWQCGNSGASLPDLGIRHDRCHDLAAAMGTRPARRCTTPFGQGLGQHRITATFLTPASQGTVAGQSTIVAASRIRGSVTNPVVCRCVTSRDLCDHSRIAHRP